MVELIESQTGLTKAQISDIVAEYLEQGDYYFAPELIDELNIVIEVSKEAK